MICELMAVNDTKIDRLSSMSREVFDLENEEGNAFVDNIEPISVTLSDFISHEKSWISGEELFTTERRDYSYFREN
jgi:hypothetical protein